ncbi:armadillo-type protein [Gamsiella multidivaricata]|uniref:armadillo-type protein n=1 Tax=Gamsiella multidivaricata TaxID=101098 RepID=UPI002220FFDC|nr:armadillo-type protein [Gamsiella multidivaricata]KAG0369922.1 Exportin-4 [Gamsiella multidivaricata]KAI7830357.1 armadillo-type protein [Gamsiella multidivaricata]
MDYPTVLATIEKACVETQHPATREQAEKVLIDFKHSANIVPVCQYLLANSNTPMVQFHAASGITGAIVREYGLYQKQDIHHLQAYLIQYNLEHPRLVSWVAKQIYQAIAVISKRGWLEASEKEQDVVYNHIIQLLSMGDQERKIGLTLAHALVDEFSSRGKASSVGLTWDFHYRTKLSFEERHLRLIFEAALKVLHEQLHDLISIPGQEVSGSQKPLLSLSILLLESILQWDFSSNSQPVLAGTFADDEDDFTRTIVYPASWRSVLVNADVLSMFFTLFPLVQDDNIMTHRVRQCLIQLCGLHGAIFVAEEAAIHHISGVMKGLLALINNVASCSSDECLQADYTENMIAITEMIRQLLSFHSIQTICAVPERFDFLNQVALLTIHCLNESAKVPEESESLMGAFDELLVTWVKLVQDSQAAISDHNSPALVADATNLLQFFHSISYRIVEKYVDTRLELAKFNALVDEESDGFQDWETYGDQLISIAALARLDPHNTLLRLQSLLHDRIERLQNFLRTTHDGSHPDYVTFLYEHLHWLIVITGYVFADNNVGETALVPDTLNEFSKSQALAQDQLVNIFSNLMSLLDSVSLDSHSAQAISCSPQVALSLFWFLERWVKTYLFIGPENYASLSSNLLQSYGEASQGGKGSSILEFLIIKLRINFIMWNADPDVLVQIIALMNTFGQRSSVRNALLQSEQFPPLVSFFIDHLSVLPEVIHNSLIQSITNIISYAPTEQLNGHYFNLISTAIETRFAAVLHDKSFQSRYQTPEVMSQIMNGLEMFNGLALALTDVNTPMIYNFCSRFFESFVDLVRVYNNFPEVQILVLRLYTDLIRNLDFMVLSADQVSYFHTCLLKLLQTFSAANLGNKRAIAWEEAEDEPYSDVSVVLEMLLSLLEVRGVDQMLAHAPNAVAPSTVVFSGINILIPMIKENMLKIPRLCTLYIRLISRLVESYPGSLIELPNDLLNNLMASLKFGIDHNILEVSHLTFQAITALALYACNATFRNSTEYVAGLRIHLDQFLKLTFEQLLFKKLDMELVDVAGSCVLALVCARQEAYGGLIQEMLGASETPLTPELQQRLSGSFQHLSEAFPTQDVVGQRELTPRDVAMTPARREVFMRFLMGVRGVLRVK